jgi:hypothetical protein
LYEPSPPSEGAFSFHQRIFDLEGKMALLMRDLMRANHAPLEAFARLRLNLEEPL